MEKFFIEHPWVLVVILIWTLPWKGAALWRSARRGHFAWFAAMLVLNTLAILEILYLLFFSGPRKKKLQEQPVVESAPEKDGIPVIERGRPRRMRSL